MSGRIIIVEPAEKPIIICGYLYQLTPLQEGYKFKKIETTAPAAGEGGDIFDFVVFEIYGKSQLEILLQNLGEHDIVYQVLGIIGSTTSEITDLTDLYSGALADSILIEGNWDKISIKFQSKISDEVSAIGVEAILQRGK